MRVEVAGLTVQFAEPVLRDVNLTVEDGEQVVLLGPSGAGKSTLLRAIMGAVQPVVGRIRVGGLDPFGNPTEVARLRRQVGCVRQRDDLVAGLSSRTNVLMAAAHEWRFGDWLAVMRGAVPRRYASRLGGLAGRHEIEPFLPVRVQYLSGGQRQRIALARALLTQPRLILADEATTGLDPARAIVALDHLRNAEGATLVLATHDLGVASQFERVVALRDGRVVFDGPRLDADAVRRIYGAMVEGTDERGAESLSVRTPNSAAGP